ncbi:Membrane metallo-endopeptidase-like 1, partial [Stegodyphus mimosarum]
MPGRRQRSHFQQIDDFTRGRNFNTNGSDVDWWSNNASLRFQEKSQCIKDRYSSYASKAAGSVTPKFTNKLLVETTADTMGLKAAYWVYCEKLDYPYLLQIIRTGSRIPQKFRVNGPMSNLPEFAQDFQCSRGKDMNPISKCEIW